MRDSFEDKISERLFDLDIEVPDHLEAGVFKELDRPAVVYYRASQFITATALMVLLIFSVGGLQPEGSHEGASLADTSVPIKNQPGKVSDRPNAEKAISDTDKLKSLESNMSDNAENDIEYTTPSAQDESDQPTSATKSVAASEWESGDQRARLYVARVPRVLSRKGWHLVDKMAPYQVEIKGDALQSDTIVKSNDDEEEQDKKERDWPFSFYAAVAPFMTYNGLEPNMSDDAYVTDIEAVPSVSAARLGTYADIGLTYRLSERLFLSGALSYIYYKSEMKLKYQSVYSESFEVDEDGYIINDRNEQLTEYISYARHGLGPQVGLTYEVSKKKSLSQIIALDLSHYFLFTQPAMQRTTIKLGYGFNGQLSSKLALRLVPTIGWSLQGERFNLVDVKPFSAGVNVGLLYTF